MKEATQLKQNKTNNNNKKKKQAKDKNSHKKKYSNVTGLCLAQAWVFLNLVR